MLLGKPVYRLEDEGGSALGDAGSGKVFTIDESQARNIAQADRAEPPEGTQAALLTADAPTEFRGRDLPAWRVDLADADNTHIWIAQTTGAIAYCFTQSTSILILS